MVNRKWIVNQTASSTRRGDVYNGGGYNPESFYDRSTLTGYDKVSKEWHAYSTASH